MNAAEKPHVHWLSPGQTQHLQELLSSNLASLRMRAGLFASHAHQSGLSFSSGEHINPDASTIVIGKIGGDCHLGRSEKWLKMLSERKKNGKLLVLDYTDHHLVTPTTPMGDFYSKILPIADKAVVPSKKMKELLHPFFKKSIAVIEDPIEVPVIPPKSLQVNSTPTVMWFGHASNLHFLIDYLENHELCDAAFNLYVLSSMNSLTALKNRRIRSRESIKVRFVEWSISNMIDTTHLCDACLIPSNTSDVRKAGASANRLITALALGLPTFASNLDSYSEFINFYSDLGSMPISNFFLNLEIEKEKIRQAQIKVLSDFSKENLSGKWLNYLTC